jgi:hypothetical protein
MTRNWKRLPALALVLGLGAFAWAGAAGADDCLCGQYRHPNLHIDNCATIPYGAQPAPPGTYINKYIQVQETKAEMDDFVFYKHMWFRGGTSTTLGPLGRYQLDLITARLAHSPFPVVIETSKDEKLDEQRREVILALLKMRGFDDPSRVVVAYPIAEGLYGDEAPRIYDGLIGLNQFFGGIYGGFGYNPGFGFGGLGGLGGVFGGFGF